MPFDGIQEGEELVEFIATEKIRFYAQKDKGISLRFFPANMVESCGRFQIM